MAELKAKIGKRLKWCKRLCSRFKRYKPKHLKRNALILGVLLLTSSALSYLPKQKWIKTLSSSVLIPIISPIFTFYVGHIIFAWREKTMQRLLLLNLNIDRDFINALGGLPKIFTYKEIQSMTKDFSEEIGKGGFAKVYKGKLDDDTPVAVKDIDHPTHTQKEFLAEIASISTLNHSNLARLLGICAEEHHRILVYEFMENGSLDGWIFALDDEKRSSIDWRTRRCIAIQAAKGLQYLHDNSRDCILHLDVKPQNVLLDENFGAKVSDFGMAACLRRDIDSRLVTSEIRGTPGYMAPEWLMDGCVTSKSDVFSFGMLLLELVSGRKNVDMSMDGESWYLPTVVMRSIKTGDIDDIVDGVVCIGGVEEKQREEVLLVLQTALWCIQKEPQRRPEMASIVKMLEGEMEVGDPPVDSCFAFQFQSEDTLAPSHGTALVLDVSLLR